VFFIADEAATERFKVSSDASSGVGTIYRERLSVAGQRSQYNYTEPWLQNRWTTAVSVSTLIEKGAPMLEGAVIVPARVADRLVGLLEKHGASYTTTKVWQ